MGIEDDLYTLVQRGGVFYDIEGDNPAEIYNNLCSVMPVPSGCSRKELQKELMERENVLSTAVGNGIAIPHPRKPLIQEDADERIVVCFPKNSVVMSTPDSKKVFVMFVLLTKNTHSMCKN